MKSNHHAQQHKRLFLFLHKNLFPAKYIDLGWGFLKEVEIFIRVA